MSESHSFQLGKNVLMLKAHNKKETQVCLEAQIKSVIADMSRETLIMYSRIRRAITPIELVKWQEIEDKELN